MFKWTDFGKNIASMSFSMSGEFLYSNSGIFSYNAASLARVVHHRITLPHGLLVLLVLLLVLAG